MTQPGPSPPAAWLTSPFLLSLQLLAAGRSLAGGAARLFPQVLARLGEVEYLTLDEATSVLGRKGAGFRG